MASKPRRGPDDPPVPLTMTLPDWPGFVCHTRAGDDRIYKFDSVYAPADPVDLRCSCEPATSIALDERDEEILFMINHRPGCGYVQDLLTACGHP